MRERMNRVSYGAEISRWRPMHLRSRRGSTLLELMCALVVLSTGLMAAFGHIYSTQRLQRDTFSREVQAITISNMVNLYAGASIQEIDAWLGDPTRRIAGTDDPPAALTTAADLVSRNLLFPKTGYLNPNSSDLSHVRYSVGFYRAMPNLTDLGLADSTRPGLWGSQSGDLGTVAAQISGRGLADHARAQARALRDTYRIHSVTATSEITEGNPIAVLVQSEELRGNNWTVLDSSLTVVGTLLP